MSIKKNASVPKVILCPYRPRGAMHVKTMTHAEGEDHMEQHAFAITVSRQIGSGGTYIAYQVAKALGFMFVDREILRRAATHLGSDQRLLEAHEEKSSGLIDNIIRVFSLGAPETAYIPKERPVYDRDLFAAESRIINEIVDRYNAVILGRGGFHVLKNRPGATHVFVHAPREFRIGRIMKVRNMTDVREARALVEESDRRRTKFVRDMARTEWADARHYHLSIDSRAAGFPACIQVIIQLVNKARSDAETGSS
jgi:cytidylate kinase